MNVILQIVIWILKFGNVVDTFLQWFGIKICKINRKTVLEGFPAEAEDEVSQPDVKLLFDETMKALEKDEEMRFFHRFQLKSLMRQQIEQRLLLRKTLSEIPEILEIPIKKPLFIVGLPRTGTTFLNWLLSFDEQYRSPPLWEQLEVCPPGRVEDKTKDPRYQRAVMAIEFRKLALSSKTYAAHATEPDKPEECLVVMLRSFYNGFLRYPLETMDNYSKIMDSTLASSETMKQIYLYYKKNLQALAYQRDMENKRYLLKAPNHLLHIEALLEVFPDSQLIFTHRRISQVVPSFLSLLTTLHEQYGGVPDEKWKRRVLSALRHMLVRGIKSIDRLEKLNGRNPVYSIAYTDLVSDPLGEMRKLYDYYGMTLTPQTESAMQNYLNNDPKKTTYGAHKYTLEEFGITMENIKEEFKEYIDIMSKKTSMENIL